MRASLSWIQEFTPVDAPVAEIVTALNQLGLEVDGVEEPGAEITGVIAARVLDVVKHPNADKLSLVDLDFGSGTTRVVCGAPNVVPGMVAPFAPSGATLPGGFTLERRKIRGEVSDGMLCSAKELGLGDDHAGIVALDVSVELGNDVREVLGLDDVIFDLAITPNRPDAMCIVGVARELAAHFKLDLVVPVPNPGTDPSAASDITVSIEAPERCPRYLGRVAQVTIGASPAWMTQRLMKAGMRSISNVVDVTNYVLLERNQPLHAFDLSRLAGRGVVVRLATDGETITALDGVERELTSADLLICDAERVPQAIAGIMGGTTSEVSDATTEILLESAYFAPLGIAQSSKRLKLRSESSARFERGIDPEAVAVNAARAMELLADVADARVAGDAVDEYPAPVDRPRIRVRASRVNAVLGTDLDAEDVWDALAALGIELDAPADATADADAGPDVLEATVPSFRPDLEREIDLVEEVARRIGFDRIGRTRPDTHGQVGALSPHQRDRRAIADALVGAGLSEAITLSLVSPADLERAGAPIEQLVRSSNPLRAEESVLRTGLLPGLLRAVAYNRSHGLTDVALFESGRVFLARDPSTVDPGEAPLPHEPEHVAGAIAGLLRRAPVEVDRPVDVHDAVDALRAVTDALRVDDVELVATDVVGLRRGRAARIVVGGRDIGSIGEVSTEVLDALGLVSPVVVFEVELDGLIGAPRRDQTFVAPSRFPASMIDLAFVVSESVPSASIARTARRAAPDVVEEVRCFDEFTSESLGAGKRSLAFAVRFRASDRTLTDAELAALRQKIIDAVAVGHDAQLR
jgi:phenylalanyl-tRNA synthetase beta chain